MAAVGGFGFGMLFLQPGRLRYKVGWVVLGFGGCGWACLAPAWHPARCHYGFWMGTIGGLF